MNFETPGRLPPLGRVRHHFRAPFGPFFFSPWAPRSYAGDAFRA
jgi:hypothetical protein